MCQENLKTALRVCVTVLPHCIKRDFCVLHIDYSFPSDKIIAEFMVLSCITEYLKEINTLLLS